MRNTGKRDVRKVLELKAAGQPAKPKKAAKRKKGKTKWKAIQNTTTDGDGKNTSGVDWLSVRGRGGEGSGPVPSPPHLPRSTPR